MKSKWHFDFNQTQLDLKKIKKIDTEYSVIKIPHIKGNMIIRETHKEKMNYHKIILEGYMGEKNEIFSSTILKINVNVFEIKQKVIGLFIIKISQFYKK